MTMHLMILILQIMSYYTRQRDMDIWGDRKKSDTECAEIREEQI